MGHGVREKGEGSGRERVLWRLNFRVWDLEFSSLGCGVWEFGLCGKIDGVCFLGVFTRLSRVRRETLSMPAGQPVTPLTV